jgi:hypothetical protein
MIYRNIKHTAMSWQDPRAETAEIYLLKKLES